MSDTEITKHFFKANGIKYFRGKAFDIELGCLGQKKDPAGANAYLAVEDRIRRSQLRGKVHRTTEVKVDWAKQRAAEVEANGKLNVFGINVKGTTAMSYEQARGGKVVLVNFAIDERPLKTLLNDTPAALKYLASEGQDARIVSSVWVATTYELYEYIKQSGAKSVSADAGDAALEFTVTGSSHGAQTLTFSPKTTFAYGMHKVKDWNKGKSQIDDLEDDNKGMG